MIKNSTPSNCNKNFGARESTLNEKNQIQEFPIGTHIQGEVQKIYLDQLIS